MSAESCSFCGCTCRLDADGREACPRCGTEPPPVVISSYAEYLAANGGFAASVEGLGVFVGADPMRCPAGWVFVPVKEATSVLVQEALDFAKTGRSQWPKKDR